MEDGLCDFELNFLSKKAIYKRFTYFLITNDLGEILKEKFKAGLVSEFLRRFGGHIVAN